MLRISNNLKTGTVFTSFRLAMLVLSGIFLTPTLMNKLGSHHYGLYLLILSSTGLIVISDFSTADTIAKYSIKSISNSNNSDEKIVFLLINTSIVLGTATIIMWRLITSGNYVQYSIEIVLASLLVIVTYLYSIGEGYIVSKGNYLFASVVELIRIPLRLTLLLLVFIKRLSVTLILSVDLVLAILPLLVVISLSKVSRFAQFSSENISKEKLKNIFFYAFSVYTISLIAANQYKVMLMFTGKNYSNISVASLGIAIMLAGYFSMFFFQLQKFYLPELSRLENSIKDTDFRAIELAKFNTSVFAIVIVCFTLVGDLVLNWWLGTNYESDMFALTCILLFVTGHSVIISPLDSLLKLKGIFWKKSLIYVISYSVVYTAINTFNWDISLLTFIQMLILPWFLGQVFSWLVFSEVVNFSAIYYYRKTVGKQLIPVLLAFVFAYLNVHDMMPCRMYLIITTLPVLFFTLDKTLVKLVLKMAKSIWNVREN